MNFAVENEMGVIVDFAETNIKHNITNFQIRIHPKRLQTGRFRTKTPISNVCRK